jgi:hypothetical protein
MASTYSSLKIQLMGTGENSGTWGTITNTNLGTAIEEAITGSANVTFNNANVTLTLTDTNSSQTARNLRLNLTGTSGGARDLIVPAIEKVYIVNNGCADTITVKNATGTGIAVPTGKTMWVFNNGTNVVDAVNHLTSLTLGTVLPITSGGTGTNLTTFCNLQSNVVGVLPNANTTAAASNGSSTIVARDSSGNFGANTITANLTGLASNATFAVTAANATNATNAASATNATNATRITNPGGWGITPSGTTLFFSYNGTNVATLDSSGNLIVIGDVTAFGSI